METEIAYTKEWKKSRIEAHLQTFKECRNACQSDEVALAIMQAVITDERVEAMKAERAERNHEFASGKQRAFLRKLGLQDVANNEKLLRIEASKLISANK